jgi:hypothetical protein
VEAKLMMKRAAIGLLMLWSAAAVAQAPFTIVRPQDGARVREVVQIRFPIRSVPQGGFIGVSINGKFVEAVAPAALDTDRERGHYIYRWDTKKLNVPDGEHTIELTLYANPEDDNSARVLGRSSVRLQVENEIKVPAEGIPLRYRWTPGKTYRYQLKGVFKEVNEVQYSGLSPEETILVDVSFKGDLSAMDFRNNLGLISWTLVPPVIRIVGGQPTVITSERTAPIYQEVETTGRVRYQVVLFADAPQRELFYTWVTDLPILPPRRYKPGDRWGATIDTSNPLRSGEIKEIGRQIPVAARLERFEWEQGYKCAKIIYEFTGNLPGTIDFDGFQLEKPKSSLRREVYFAYDLGQVIRVKTLLQLEGRVRQEETGGGFTSPGMPGRDRGGERDGATGGIGVPGFRGAQTGARNIINRFVFESDMRLLRVL